MLTLKCQLSLTVLTSADAEQRNFVFTNCQRPCMSLLLWYPDIPAQAGSPEFSLTAGARRRMASLERIRNPAARRRLAKHVPTFSRAATAAAGKADAA
jgi:hypothetical protein